MRLDINLSRDPFRNRSLLWLGIAIAYMVTLAAGIAVLARSGVVDADTDEIAKQVEKQNAEIASLEQQIAEARKRATTEVLTDGDLAELADAHDLVTRKSLSWTQLLAELERYVPERSKLTSVSLGSVEGRGRRRVAKLTLSAVGSDSSQPAAMIASFDSSGGRFSVEPVSIDPGPGEVSFTLTVEYRPGIGSSEPQAGAEPASGGEEGRDG